MANDRKLKQKAHSVDTVATILGSCALVILAVFLSEMIGILLTMIVGGCFLLSGKQRGLFHLLAAPLHRFFSTGPDIVDAGSRKGSFASRPAPPITIEHDPNEFSHEHR